MSNVIDFSNHKRKQDRTKPANDDDLIIHGGVIYSEDIQFVIEVLDILDTTGGITKKDLARAYLFMHGLIEAVIEELEDDEE